MVQQIGIYHLKVKEIKHFTMTSLKNILTTVFFGVQVTLEYKSQDQKKKKKTYISRTFGR